MSKKSNGTLYGLPNRTPSVKVFRVISKISSTYFSRRVPVRDIGGDSYAYEHSVRLWRNVKRRTRKEGNPVYRLTFT